MTHADYQSLPLDELWSLHQRIGEVIVQKSEAEMQMLQSRLDQICGNTQLGPTSGRIRRPYPKVKPKFQNPQNPSETWSGRGRPARWLSELLAAGQSLDDLKIRGDELIG